MGDLHAACDKGDLATVKKCIERGDDKDALKVCV